jgi:uncharacterized protein YcbK (DUF882 family)
MTELQINSLLCYLGYFDTKEALKKFQEDNGLSVSGTCDAETEKALLDAVSEDDHEKDDFWGGIKYFTRDEFKCKCGKYCNGFPVEPDERLVRFLDGLREHFGVPVTVTSGVRCKQHNANVNGASRSQHMLGNAADIKVRGIDPVDVYEYADEKFGKSGGVGLYKNFTHVDVRSTKSRWNG